MAAKIAALTAVAALTLAPPALADPARGGEASPERHPFSGLDLFFDQYFRFGYGSKVSELSDSFHPSDDHGFASFGADIGAVSRITSHLGIGLLFGGQVYTFSSDPAVWHGGARVRCRLGQHSSLLATPTIGFGSGHAYSLSAGYRYRGFGVDLEVARIEDDGGRGEIAALTGVTLDLSEVESPGRALGIEVGVLAALLVLGIAAGGGPGPVE